MAFKLEDLDKQVIQAITVRNQSITPAAMQVPVIERVREAVQKLKKEPSRRNIMSNW